MPRQARIDAPGALRHILIRRIEQRGIFEDDKDRPDRIDYAPTSSRAVQRAGNDANLIAAAATILEPLELQTSQH
ncbi:MAG: hypothetical protein ABIE47_09385 [Pseudomonadota bacterium]